MIILLIILSSCIIAPSELKASGDRNESLPELILEEKDEYTKLNGNWLFFEGELLVEPEESTEHGVQVHIPSDFLSHTDYKNNYGTYITSLRLPEHLIGKSLAIYVPYQYSAYNLYVNGQLIARNGLVGTDAESHQSEMAPKTGYFTVDAAEIQLSMQVSSFEHIRGGFENSIFIGESVTVNKKVDSETIFGSFIIGTVFIIGIFMILFFLYRRTESLFLIFGLFALSISIRSFFTVPFHYTILWPQVPWVWGTRLEYIFTIISSMIYIMLIWKWHEKEFSKVVMYIVVTIHLVITGITFITKPVVFQALFFNLFYIAIPVFIYFIYVVLKSIRTNNVSAKVNLVGITIIFLAFLNDFFIGQGFYASWNLMLPAVVLYIVMHVVFMSRQFAESMFQIERQNIELTKLNKSNELLTGKLQEEIKRKDDFLANTSHELRNPLHGMINIAHSILMNKANKLDEQMTEEIQLQIKIGHHMARTLDDLLDITRLKEQRLVLKKSQFAVEPVINAVVDMIDVLVEHKSVTIEVQIDESLPEIVADKNRLIQILFNLLHNALKYTHEGKIMIRVYEEESLIKFKIEDNGIGMDKRLLDRLFLPYEQGESNTRDASGGLGLGLSICKDLIELHGGSITASSKLGVGSTFTFTLPVRSLITSEKVIEDKDILFDHKMIEDAISPSYHQLIDKLTENQTTTSSSRILIVDDDIVNIRVLTNVLSNYRVEAASSGKEALQLLQNNSYELLITDVMMPEMSGYELTKKVREKHSISELPIILLTARNNSDDIYSGFLVGANDYLIKPVDAMELIVRVEALTNLQASIKERLRMEAAWLHAQIRPHFLLNTLNSIVSLSRIDTERMIMLIDHLSVYLQSSFQFKNVEKLVLLSEELSLVESYLYIQQERFGERLNVKWDVVEVNSVAVPPLSVQTIVENAVHHGILKKSEGGTVTIRVCEVTKGVLIEVIDDGIGMSDQMIEQLLLAQPDKKRGIGLINTELRLQALLNTKLNIESTLDKGTKISFIIPLN